MTRRISFAARSVICTPRPFLGAWGSLAVGVDSLISSLCLAGVGRRAARIRGRLLLLVVRDRGLDRVLGQHRAVDLDRWERELLDDLRVLDLHRLVDRAAL